MKKVMKGYLVLADGTIFQGEAFGAATVSVGEAVFNTGMTGYQEVLTDPSYCGQIVAMTYPLIGNYGINPDDFESRESFVRGFVVKELCADPSHWQSTKNLDTYLKEQRVVGLGGIDTRALTRHLRERGTMNAVIASSAAETITPATKEMSAPGGLLAISGKYLVSVPQSFKVWARRQVAKAGNFVLAGTVAEATTEETYTVTGRRGGPRVVVIDLGAKENIIRELNSRGCTVTVVPADTSATEILSLDPSGVMLTNGPGDPTDIPQTIREVKKIIQHGTAVFGICLGHQILALALGAKTFKLKFGHRGVNHPVKDLATGKVYITSQNHGYTVDGDSLPADVEVTHINLNDRTVEGLAHRTKPVFSVQYHPEASPGPRESAYLFDRFIGEITEGAYA